MRSGQARTIFLALVVASAALTGCGGGDDAATSDPNDEATAWQQVLDQIGPDGEVSKEMALQALSLAFGGLPGVAEPNGPSESVPSGSGALRWILRYRDQLTPEQSEIVDNAVALSGRSDSDGGPGQRAGAVPGDGAGAEPYRAVVDQVMPQIAANLGGINLFPAVEVNVWVPNETQINQLCAKTTCEPDMPAFTVPSSASGGQTGALRYCDINVMPQASGLGSDALQSIMAHEVMHCYLYHLVGIDTAVALPPWLGEGIPSWVGESLAGGSSASKNWWSNYLTTPGYSLFGRAYSAIGFYAHIDDRGVSPWSVIGQMIQQGASSGNAAAFGVATVPGGDALLDAWPTGLVRDTSLGAIWDTTGPGITGDNAGLAAGAVTNSAPWTKQIELAANSFTDLQLDADVVQVQTAGTYGRIRFADGSEVRPTDLDGRNLCTLPGGCECPDGSAGAGLEFEPAPANRAIVAFTGGAAGVTVTFTGVTLEALCEQDAPVAAGLDECLVGTWVSTAIKPAVGGSFPGAEVVFDGGAGAVFTVEQDGAATIDFDPMDIVHSTLTASGAQVGTSDIAFTGQVGGTISTSGDEVFSIGIETNTWAYEGIATTDVGDFPVSGSVMPQGAASAFDATYTCSATTLDYTITGEGVSTGSTWARS